MWVFDTILQLIDALAVALVISFVFGTIIRGVPEGRGRNALIGFLFGAAGVLVMLSPVEFGDGVFIDMRSIMIVLAAAFAGAEAGLIALVIVSVARLGLGLPEVNGLLIWLSITFGFAAEVAGALIWRRWLRSRFKSVWAQAASLVLIVHLFVLATMNWSIATSVPGLLAVMGVKYAVCVFGIMLAGVVMLREEDLAHMTERLSTWAMRDELTNVLNRRGLNDECDGQLGAGPYAVICLDLDGFKTVNDRGGHAVGDAVLVEIATALTGAVGEGGILARVGGDEIVVVLPGATKTSAMAEARELSRIVQVGFERSNILPAPLSASIGVHWSAGETPLHTMMQMADKALYRAKAAGRSAVVVSEEGQTQVPLGHSNARLTERA
jgi:diguanylate cyclase (GGDEF)-like protein